MATYDEMTPSANKMINPDGSVTTLKGETIVSTSNKYDKMAPFANKVLNPDGTITKFTDELPGGGTGGGIESVNGDAGPVVVLNQDDVLEGLATKQFLNADKNNLDQNVDDILYFIQEMLTAPNIIYTSLSFDTGQTGTVQPLILGGNKAQSFEAITMPNWMDLNIATGEITYTAPGTNETGDLVVKAINLAGEHTFSGTYEVSQGNGILEFTNSENKYPAMRLGVSGFGEDKILLKLDFYGKTTATSNGTIIEDSSYPIWVIDNLDGTWSYMINVSGYSYWMLYRNSTTDPTTLIDGLSTDLTTFLNYNLVSPHSDDVLVDLVNYPSDQSEVHYLTSLKYIEVGTDASLNGFMADDADWSFGFTLTDDIPTDSLGRCMFARTEVDGQNVSGRNFLAMTIGQNAVYTYMVVGNGSNITYDTEDNYPGTIAAGSEILVTGDSGVINIYVDGALAFSYNSSFYLDSQADINNIPLVFGLGVESNLEQSNNNYYHALWQGRINNLWISNGTIEPSTTTGVPATSTHHWLLDETTGKTFDAQKGGIDAIGKKI